MDTIEKVAQLAFDKRKDFLLEPPVLELPRREGHFTVDTDACEKKIGGL